MLSTSQLVVTLCQIKHGLGPRIFVCRHLVLIKIVLVKLYRGQGCQAANVRSLEALKDGGPHHLTAKGGPWLASGIRCGFLLGEHWGLLFRIHQLRGKQCCRLLLRWHGKSFRLQVNPWGHDTGLRQCGRLRLAAQLLLFPGNHILGRQDGHAGAPWLVLQELEARGNFTE